MTNGRSWIVALFVAMTWLVPSAVGAQRVAVSYGNFFGFSTEVINLGTGVVESRDPRIAGGRPVFTSDGRFLLLRFRDAGGLPRLLEIRDLVTGSRTPLDLQFVPHHAHPRRLAVYGLASGVVARLDLTGLRPYASCNGAAWDVELTVDGSQALVARGVAGAGTELVLVDVATGTQILSTPMPGPPPPAPFSGPGLGYIVSVTPSRDAVVITNRWFYDEVGRPGPARLHYRTQILGFATLAPRLELAVPYDPHFMEISPDGGHAFVASNDLLRPFGQLQDLDLRTGQQTVGVSTLTSALGAAFAPLAPTLQPAEVIGQQVTIAWSLAAHSPAAQRFVLHVGSRSGATDLGTRDVGDATSLTVPGVPPGRYFVRMTAVNFTGTSSPSTELIVDVPGQ